MTQSNHDTLTQQISEKVVKEIAAFIFDRTNAISSVFNQSFNPLFFPGTNQPMMYPYIQQGFQEMFNPNNPRVKYIENFMTNNDEVVKALKEVIEKQLTEAFQKSSIPTEPGVFNPGYSQQPPKYTNQFDDPNAPPTQRKF